MFTDTELHTAVMTLTVYNGHDFGSWKSNGDDTHTRICKNDGCGYSEKKTAQAAKQHAQARQSVNIVGQNTANLTAQITALIKFLRRMQPLQKLET